MVSPLPQDPATTQAFTAYDDEISLTDLALTIWRRRRIVLAVIILALLAGAAFAFLRPRAYEYKATIEIGTQTVGKDGLCNLFSVNFRGVGHDAGVTG